MIKTIDDIRNDDELRIGSKAFNLWNLAINNFKVPTFAVVVGDISSEIDLNFPVAVRSTFPGEDSKEKSHAGEFKSFLNVTKDNIASKIRECREAYPLNNPDAPVLIQEMIDSDYSGVSFSLNPVTGERDKVIIEMVKGICDKMLTGLESGFHYEVSSLGEIADTNGSTLLSEDKILAVADLTRSIELHFGYPVDVEWAIKGEDLYVIQARPITSDIPPEFKIDNSDFVNKIDWKWNCSHVGRDPMSPLASSIIEIADSLGGMTRQKMFNGYHFVGNDPDTLNTNTLTANVWLGTEQAKWDDVLEDLRSVNLSSLTDADLVSTLSARVKLYSEFSKLAFNGFTGPTNETKNYLNRLADEIKINGIKDFQSFLNELSVGLNSIARQRDVAMTNLSEQTSEDEFQLFIHNYGDMLLHNFDIAKRTFAEDHTSVMNTVQMFTEKTQEHYKKSLLRRERIIDSIIENSTNKTRTARELKLIEEHLLRRENDDYYMVSILGQLRYVCLEIANRTGIGEDIFYLDLTHLPRLMKGETLTDEIEKGKKEYKLWTKMVPPKSIVSGIKKYTLDAREPGLYHGLPVCKGYVEGKPVIIDNENDLASIKEGDILICDTFVPSMTYVIPRLKGLVAQFGIMNSHGAIVTREYNVPAVFGIGDLDDELRAAEKISLDGSEGIVKILS